MAKKRYGGKTIVEIRLLASKVCGFESFDFSNKCAIGIAKILGYSGTASLHASSKFLVDLLINGEKDVVQKTHTCKQKAPPNINWEMLVVLNSEGIRGSDTYKLMAEFLESKGLVKHGTDKAFCISNYDRIKNLAKNAYGSKCEQKNLINGVDVSGDAFLSSYEWRTLRMVAIKKYGRTCACCGVECGKNGIVLNVDHIKPRRKYPELALNINNLQILCNTCNHGKGNWDETDWRQK